MFMDLKSDVLTLQNQCPKVNPSVSKISLPLQFLSAGMKFAGENHPCERIFIGRDDISEEESSLRENSVCRDEISRGESSLRENFHRQG